MDIPNTRASLILRLRDPADANAWEQFAAIYEPLVYRLARKRGLQHADAQELVQEVLLAVSRAVDDWVPDAQRGRFRDWLFRIARNLMIKFLTRRKHRPLGSGDSGIAELLTQQHDPHSAESTLFELEFRREVFQWTAGKVQPQVGPRTWDAFWLSSVDGLPIRDVAAQLRMSIGSVYIARSRVMLRLREQVQQFERLADNVRDNGAKLER